MKSTKNKPLGSGLPRSPEQGLEAAHCHLQLWVREIMMSNGSRMRRLP